MFDRLIEAFLIGLAIASVVGAVQILGEIARVIHV